MISAKLCVFAGGSFQLSLGEASGPSHVNFLGIISLAEKAELTIFMLPPWVCPAGVAPRNGERHKDRAIKAVNTYRINAALAILTQVSAKGSAETRRRFLSGGCGPCT